MGRTGVTYEAVLKAASLLAAEGKNPTVDAVREQLGTGSKSTIAPLLKRWKLEQQGIVAIATREGLPEGLTAAVNDLYNRLQQASDSKLLEVTERCERELDRAQKDLDSINARAAEMEKLYLEAQSKQNQLQNQLDTVKEQSSATLEENRSLRTKVDTLERWLAEKQDELKEQRDIVRRAQENFIHYQAKVQERREQEKMGFDSEVGRIRATMHEIQSELQQIQNENQALSDQIERLKQHNDLLKHQLNEKDYEVEKHSAHLNDLKSANKQLEGQLFVVRQQSEASTQELKEERTQRSALDRKLAISEHQTSTLVIENARLKEKLEATEAEKIKLLGRLAKNEKS